MIEFGIDRIVSGDVFKTTKEWGRVALLANQASRLSKPGFEASFDIFFEYFGDRLIRFFGPQHGFLMTKQDNMIETADDIHPYYKIPISSLYSTHRTPTADMLEGIDTLVIDLPVTGCRVYTYKSTVNQCLIACQKLKKKVVILDRPHPLGGYQSMGPTLHSSLESFVGPDDFPLLHPMTMGEVSIYMNRKIHCDLDVVTLKNWNPGLNYQQHGLTWIPTSPNLPNFASVQLYPGMVMFEATNVSEGRGTSCPFQVIGAPFITNTRQLKQKVLQILRSKPTNIELLEVSFEPQFQKWANTPCNGLQLIPNGDKSVFAIPMAIAILKALKELYPDQFQWKMPPYEYEYEKLPIDMIYGQPASADLILKQDPWQSFDEDYKRLNLSSVFLYPRAFSPSLTDQFTAQPTEIIQERFHDRL